MNPIELRAKLANDARTEAQLSRHVIQCDTTISGKLTCNGGHFINYSSNDYLGLAQHPDLKQSFKEGVDRYGSGSSASPLVIGQSAAHHQLEEKLCDWLGYDTAVLFGSGFSANQSILFSLLSKGDLLLQDRLNHASLIEAGLFCTATMKRFKHNDPQHLFSLLESASVDTPKMVVTEGVFSMDGDISPLNIISNRLADDTCFMVDDAHGIGVLGRGGRGTTDYLKVKPDVLVVTFGKAFGIAGAAVLCNSELGRYLKQFARHYVYSTAMPPAQAQALCKATEIVEEEEWRRDKLRSLSHYFHNKTAHFTDVVKTKTPIKPIVMGSSERALNLSSWCKQNGCWLTAIRPPTVPNNTARVRLTLTANHTESMLNTLIDSMEQYYEQDKGIVC
ncbi:8-amino-7-oxononanoate synthase [Vibrio sp.]|nr:8-amino-7-oxononanoate synthase [Vibrio sp.]